MHSRTMLFIDGNYLQLGISENYPNNELMYSDFSRIISYRLLERFHRGAESDVIRSYYYDAVPDDLSLEKPEHKALLDRLRDTDGYEVRLGRLKNDGNGKPRQKGVDTLVALDMVSKAYEDHYDMAILVAGDDDFLDIVKAVKNAGKRVIGVYFEKHISKSLRQAFDYKFVIDNNNLLGIGVLGAKPTTVNK